MIKESQEEEALRIADKKEQIIQKIEEGEFAHTLFNMLDGMSEWELDEYLCKYDEDEEYNDEDDDDY